MKKVISLSTLLLSLSLFVFTKPIYALDLSEIESATGIDIIYSGNEQNLKIDQILPGAYEIKATTFACAPGTSGCEPDRYEIRFPEVIRPIYGLGTLDEEEKVEVSDFIDSAFSSCHYVSTTQGVSGYQCDYGRLRTPMLVLPTRGLILAYLQPAVKILRLTRDGTNGCPVNNTCIVFKKHHLYDEGAPAPLLIIKQVNMMQLYETYSKALKLFPNFFFRQPNYKNFGVGWETFAEVGCDARIEQLNSIVDKYSNAGVNLSSLTIGSGFWNTDTVEGCGSSLDSNAPATDTLQAHQTRLGGLTGLTNFFDSLKIKGISPMIGMRTRIKLGEYQSQNQPSRVSQFFADYGIAQPYMNNGYEYTYDELNGSPIKAKLIDPNNLIAWLNILQNGKKSDPNDGYGNFAGFKMDDFTPADQKGYTDDPTASNLPDDFFAEIHPLAYAKFGQDFLIHSREQWFSPSADANTGIMWAKHVNHDNYEKFGYLYKFADDKALSEVISGYPHVRSAETGSVWKCTNDNGQETGGRWCQGEGLPNLNPIPTSQAKQFLRTNQIVTFYPVTNISTGFWRTKNLAYQNAIIFYERLRTRLQQYAYDQAMRTFHTGVPWGMQPLFIRWYSTNPDAPEYTMYNQILRSTTDLDQKHPNEFMFGNALLVRPLYTNSNQVNVYLPTGNWRGFIKASGPFTGPTTISYSLDTDKGNANDFPVFLKEGEILLISDYNDLTKMQAYVFLDNINQSTIYETYSKSGTKTQLQATKNNNIVTIKNLDTNQQLAMHDDQYNKGFKAADINLLLNDSPSGDLNSDGKINIFDYNELVTKFGKPYTDSDYQNILANFGK